MQSPIYTDDDFQPSASYDPAHGLPSSSHQSRRDSTDFAMPTKDSSLSPTWHGFVHTTLDALMVLEGCLRGKLSHIGRRPTDRDRSRMMVSGNCFVYEENASGIKRWTDGITWSPSRIMGNFLVYRELNEPFPAGEKKKAKKRKRGNEAPEQFTMNNPQMEEDRKLVGSLVDSYGFKPEGLVKKTLNVKYNNVNHHIVCYYTLDDVKRGSYQRPRFHPSLFNVIPRVDLFEVNFKSGCIDPIEDRGCDDELMRKWCIQPTTNSPHPPPPAPTSHFSHQSAGGQPVQNPNIGPVAPMAMPQPYHFTGLNNPNFFTFTGLEGLPHQPAFPQDHFNEDNVDEIQRVPQAPTYMNDRTDSVLNGHNVFKTEDSQDNLEYDFTTATNNHLVGTPHSGQQNHQQFPFHGQSTHGSPVPGYQMNGTPIPSTPLQNAQVQAAPLHASMQNQSMQNTSMPFLPTSQSWQTLAPTAPAGSQTPQMMAVSGSFTPNGMVQMTHPQQGIQFHHPLLQGHGMNGSGSPLYNPDAHEHSGLEEFDHHHDLASHTQYHS